MLPNGGLDSAKSWANAPNIYAMHAKTRTKLRSVLVGAVALGMLLVSAGAANANLYWANYGDSSIATAKLNGSDATVLDTGLAQNLNAVAVGFTGYIYWASYDENSIGRMKIDGSDPDPYWFVGVSSPAGLAVTDTHMYWAEDGNNRIGRATLDGNEIDRDFVTDMNGPHGLAVQGDYLYIANTGGGNIVRAALSDGTSQVLLSVNDPQMVATNSSYIYWTNFRGESIGRAPLDGSDRELEFISQSGSWTYGIAVDSEHIYWTNYTGTQSVARALLDGTEIEASFVPNQYYPVGLAAVSPPTITSVSPNVGDPSGGTRITIDGSSYFQAAEVTIGGAECTDLEWLSSSKLTCTAPAGTAGAAAVEIVNPDEQTVELADGFTYEVPPPPPTPDEPQVPVNGCAKAPASVPLVGKVRLLKPGCETTAGQPVKVKVKGRALATRGDVQYYKVIRKPNGRTLLKTFGYPVKLTVTWSAKPTASTAAYKKVRTYR